MLIVSVRIKHFLCAAGNLCFGDTYISFAHIESYAAKAGRHKQAINARTVTNKNGLKFMYIASISLIYEMINFSVG